MEGHVLLRLFQLFDVQAHKFKHRMGNVKIAYNSLNDQVMVGHVFLRLFNVQLDK